MNPTHLRIGNIVRDKISGDLLRITELNETTVGATVINRDKYPLPDGWEMEPIPLTPEILVKYGFKKFNLSSGHYFQLDFNNKEAFLFDERLSYGIMGIANFEWSACDHIHHLHQLQNLYFALTGEELNYTL